MIFIETERLVLRNVESKDADIMHDYRNNEICARYQRGQTKDYVGIVTLIENHQNDTINTTTPYIVAVAEKQTDQLLGEIVVMPKDGTISLGYTFTYKEHRKGYAFEALSMLIDLIHMYYPAWDFICFTEPVNIASKGLLIKLGFKDMGFLSVNQSQVFGKWVNAITEAEISQAIKQIKS